MKLSLKQKAAFGLGAVGKDMVYALSASYVMFYYQDILGLSATFVGLILMIARVFDALNDPFMGVLVAKTKTRWGRFRPWLFSGTILNAIVLYALFAAPVGSGANLMVYFSVVYILWGVTYTMMDIPYWSMIPAVTDTPQDRENLSVVGRTCAGVTCPWWAAPARAWAAPSSPCSPCWPWAPWAAATTCRASAMWPWAWPSSSSSPS